MFILLGIIIGIVMSKPLGKISVFVADLITLHTFYCMVFVQVQKQHDIVASEISPDHIYFMYNYYLIFIQYDVYKTSLFYSKLVVQLC